MKLRLTELKYVGHIISKDGIKRDPKKVETILNICHRQQMQSNLIHGYGKLPLKVPKNNTELLRKLEQKSQDWHWSDNQ